MSTRWWLRQQVNDNSRGPVGRAGAYFKPGCALRFAKPSVMQGVPLPTRGYSRTAGRKSGTRRSGAAARAASARPAVSSEVPPSVVSVSLLERWNYVAQVLRLHRDYFKLDNYRDRDLDRRPRGSVSTSVTLYINVCVGTCDIQVYITCTTCIIQSFIAMHANLLCI